MSKDRYVPNFLWTTFFKKQSFLPENNLPLKITLHYLLWLGVRGYSKKSNPTHIPIALKGEQNFRNKGPGFTVLLWEKKNEFGDSKLCNRNRKRSSSCSTPIFVLSNWWWLLSLSQGGSRRRLEMGSQSQGEEKDRGGREIWAREAVAVCVLVSSCRPFFFSVILREDTGNKNNNNSDHLLKHLLNLEA